MQDALSQLDALEQAQVEQAQDANGGAPGAVAGQDALAGALEDCALRLEKIAARLESA